MLGKKKTTGMNVNFLTWYLNLKISKICDLTVLNSIMHLLQL